MAKPERCIKCTRASELHMIPGTLLPVPQATVLQLTSCGIQAERGEANTGDSYDVQARLQYF